MPGRSFGSYPSWVRRTDCDPGGTEMRRGSLPSLPTFCDIENPWMRDRLGHCGAVTWIETMVSGMAPATSKDAIRGWRAKVTGGLAPGASVTRLAGSLV